jgi:hypothetical protein
MTRKDYVMIAEAIRSVLIDVEREAVAESLSDRGRAVLTGERVGAYAVALGAYAVALRLADKMAGENARFDREIFLRACSLSA